MSFKAKYEGKCAQCHEPIEPGQEVKTYGMTAASRIERYEHVDCVPSLKASPTFAETICSICGDKWAECACP